jgi:hypothetical protein
MKENNSTKFHQESSLRAGPGFYACLLFILSLIVATGVESRAQTGTLASWDFRAKGGQASVATTTAMSGVSATSPSLVASLATGLSAINYLGNGLTGGGQTATSLAAAISGNDYISFTVTPTSGRTLSVNSVKIRPVSQNRSRSFTLMSSVRGFTAGNEISTFSANASDGAPLTTVSITGHANLTGAVEFRLYVYGYTDQWESAGIGNRAAALSEADLIVEGSLSTSTVVLRNPENPAATASGLDYQYYEGTGWSVLPDFNALTAIKSGTAANFDPGVRNRDDNFGVSFTGFVNVPTDGTYTFYTSSDDGSKLFIGTTEVVNNDGLHGSQERSGTIGLKAGKHAVRVVFFEATGGEVLAVSYAGPGITKQAIPATALSRATAHPYVVRELWSNVTGTTVAAIPVNTTPTSTSQLTSLEGPTNVADNYGSRIRGYITPATSGSYTFYIASDDNAQLLLSTSDNPANKVKIAEVTDWTNAREWTKQSTQTSTARSLTAGTKYYVEVLHKEGGGGDNLAVGWTGPGISAITVIGGSVLSPYLTGPSDPSNGMPQLNVGMNPGAVTYYSKQNAFKNMAKQSSTFLTGYNGGPWDTQQIGSIPADINGYPLELPFNGNVFVHAVLPFYYPVGRYVLTYTGDGDVQIGGNATVTASRAGRIEFDYRQYDNGGLVEYKILRSTRGNHVRNIVVVPIALEGQDVLTNPFRADFLEYLKPLQAQRFMGFMHINGAREMVEWTDRALVGDYTYQSGDVVEDYMLRVKGIAGVPIEVCAQLCNILQQDGWFCVPHVASDDFIRQYAWLVKERMNPGLKVYVEYSNEVWNWGYAFPQSHYIINNAPGHPNAYVSAALRAISPNTDMHPEKDAYMIGRTMRLWTEEWAGSMNRLVRVAAVQHGWVDNTRRVLEYLKTNNMTVDAVSPAGYFGLKWDVRNRLNARGAALTYQEVVNGVTETFDTEEKPNTLAQAAYARQYGLAYVAYEGGSHVDSRGDDTERLRQLIAQYDDSQDVYNLYKRNFELHASPEVNCRIFCALTYVSTPGAFGHLEYLGEPMSSAPKYRALVEASPSTYVPVYPAPGARLSNEGQSSGVLEGVTLYPNPTSGELFIRSTPGKALKASFTNMQGVRVDVVGRQSAAGDLRLDISNQPAGIYLLRLEAGGKTRTYKIAKQ